MKKHTSLALTAVLASALASCTPQKKGSCPIRTINAYQKTTEAVKGLNTDSESKFDKSDKGILFEEFFKAEKHLAGIEFKVTKNPDNKDYTWQGSGLALRNPETNTSYVLTTMAAVFPQQFKGHWDIKVDDYNLVPVSIDGYSSGVLFEVNCEDDCLNAYDRKFATLPSTGDYFIGFDFQRDRKSEFSGVIDGIETIMGLLPTKIKVNILRGEPGLGSLLYVSEDGHLKIAGLVAGGQKDNPEVIPMGKYKTLLERKGLSHYFEEK